MKQWKVVVLYIVLTMSMVSCNYPTPKMACEEDLEIYSEGCFGTLLMYQDGGSEATLGISTLLCAQYMSKKEECDDALY